MAQANPKYLVFYRMEDIPLEPVLETAAQIFNKMDMDDCYPISIWKLYSMDASGDLRECSFNGTWHESKDPLKMTITDEYGRILEAGWGSDH